MWHGLQSFFCWLVVWLPLFIFPHTGLLIIPIDELHHFSEGWVYWPGPPPWIFMPFFAVGFFSPAAGLVRTTTQWEVRHLVRYHSLSQDVALEMMLIMDGYGVGSWSIMAGWRSCALILSWTGAGDVCLRPGVLLRFNTGPKPQSLWRPLAMDTQESESIRTGLEISRARRNCRAEASWLEHFRGPAGCAAFKSEDNRKQRIRPAILTIKEMEQI